MLIVVENPILARQVNTRNYARPRFLLPFAGEQPEGGVHSHDVNRSSSHRDV